MGAVLFSDGATQASILRLHLLARRLDGVERKVRIENGIADFV
jgi:hypothetical protein